jgi:hypothetical protein
MPRREFLSVAGTVAIAPFGLHRTRIRDGKHIDNVRIDREDDSRGRAA